MAEAGAGVKDGQVLHRFRADSLQVGASAVFSFRDKDGYDKQGFVVRHEDGFHAYENRCPHWGTSLDWDDAEFLVPQDLDLIQCKTHGATFEADTGFCLAGPCIGDTLRAFQVAVEGDEITVRMAGTPRS